MCGFDREKCRYCGLFLQAQLHIRSKIDFLKDCCFHTFTAHLQLSHSGPSPSTVFTSGGDLAYPAERHCFFVIEEVYGSEDDTEATLCSAATAQHLWGLVLCPGSLGRAALRRQQTRNAPKFITLT